MAISKTNPVSTSTEGIVTIKIAAQQCKVTLTTPLPAGSYAVSTGYSGSMGIRLYNSAGTVIQDFGFSTSSSFTIADAATVVEINSPATAVNGIVSFQILQRGVSASTNLWNSVNLVSDQHRFAAVIANSNGVYIIGGHNNIDWSSTGGTGTIEKWDRTSSTTTVVATDATALSRRCYATKVGTDIYFYNSNPAASSFWKFNTNTNTLSAMANMVSPRSLDTIVTNNQGTKIYVIGAYQGNSGAGYSEVYTIASNTWATIAAAPFTNGGYGGQAWTDSTNNDYIYTANYVDQATVWRYNITANTWTNLGIIGFPGEYTTRGVKTLTGNHYYYLLDGTPTANLSTGHFGILGATASTLVSHVRDISAYPTMYGAVPITANGGIAGNYSGTSMDIDSQYLYVSGFIQTYTGKLLYKKASETFPATGFGN